MGFKIHDLYILLLRLKADDHKNLILYFFNLSNRTLTPPNQTLLPYFQYINTINLLMSTV